MHAPLVPAARPLARLFTGLAVVSWVLIAFGALVRAKKAGLACPDWPLCHGQVVPDIHLEGVIYEFGHRALAGGVALIFTLGAILIARQPALWPKMKAWVIAGGVLLLVQIVFGGLTVLIVHSGDGTPRPATWTVSTHLILGNAFAALALLTGMRLRDLADGPRPLDGQPVPKLANILRRVWTTALIAQFVLGGLIAGNIAGLVCTEFPTCNGGVWFPAFSGLVGLQVFHRLNAYLMLTVGLVLAWKTRDCGRLSRITAVLAGLVVLQGVLGAANVLSYLHTDVTTAHSAVAALLFSATAVLESEMGRRKRAIRQG